MVIMKKARKEARNLLDKEMSMDPMKLRIKRNPNFQRLEKVLRREGTPDRVPLYELFSNIESEVLRAIGKTHKLSKTNKEHQDRELSQHINYMLSLGYDYVNVGANNFHFPQKERPSTTTSEGERSYFKAATCTISNRTDFDSYPWPKMSNVDYSPLQDVVNFIPEGMKVITGGPGGILENVMWLLGYEKISYCLYDDKELLQNMFEAVATRIIEHYNMLSTFDIVGALVLGEDMGFKTQTLLSPEVYREYLFPWHAKLVETVHAHGKPIILHSCGNLTEIMDDIIDCGWDAKHSFEDEIEPVWEAKQSYGDRIALLGGFDMNKLCLMSEAEVRQHTRFLIDKCSPGGGWALGTGNSVPNYVPINNFLAMLEEGNLRGKY